MALTDREILKKAQAGHVGSSGMALDPSLEVAKMHQRTYTVLVADAATAATAVTETAIITVPTACRFIGAKIVAPIAVAAAASNIATFNIARERAGVSVNMAAGSTVTAGTPGSLTAFVAAALVNNATSANLDLVAGDTITIAVVKGASGVALTAATSYLQVQVTVEENGV